MIETETYTGIREFVAEDMVWVIERGVKEFGLKAMADDHIRELAQAREDNGQCITGVVKDEIIGCGGIDIMWDTVGEVWLMLSYEVNKYPIKTYEVIEEGLEKLIKNNNLRRIQGWGRIGFHQSHTLFRHLGFQPEGLARKYGYDGSDFILYSLIRD